MGFALSHLWAGARPGVPLQAVQVAQHTKMAWQLLRHTGTSNRTLRIRVWPKLCGISGTCLEAITDTIKDCRPILEGSSVPRELFIYLTWRRSTQTSQSPRRKQTQHYRPTHANHLSHAVLFQATPNAAQSARRNFISSPLFTASMSKSSW